MPPQTLVVSDPPHGDVGTEAVADALSLEADSVRGKIAFPAPEILAASDPGPARALAASLREHGMSVEEVAGEEIAELPWPERAVPVETTPGLLVTRTDRGLLELDGHDVFWVVSCQPPAELAREPGADLRDLSSRRDPAETVSALEWVPHLDLLFGDRGRRRRIVVVDDVPRTLARIEEGFSGADVDRRLDNIRPRQRFVAGEAGFDPDLRKAFSFGTLLLRQLLESISSDLRDIPQYEFAARLSYALRI
ncbi:MAG: hypothetical protein R3304_12270 [Longimicrobiales bacterium]|nr:hypothetical protein [Longimicrobiales bacterium]